MGVRDFSKVFDFSIKGSLATVVRRSNINCVAIDASYELYRANLGLHSSNTLRDSQGNPTLHLNVIITNVARLKKLGVRCVYVFDSPDPNKHKKYKRPQSLEAHAVTQSFGEIVREIKWVLDKLGVPHIDAPSGYEAEQVASALNREGIVDAVLTRDTDVLAFGGEKLLSGSGNSYNLYSLEDILNRYELSYEEFVNVCVSLGTDFAPKVKGVGPKTALIKGKTSTLFTPEQNQAKAIFMDLSVPLLDVECAYSRDDRDLDELVRWLVDEKNFSESRIVKFIK